MVTVLKTVSQMYETRCNSDW